jgi:MFS family permease
LTDEPTTTEHFLAGRNINGYYAFHLFVNAAFWLPIYAIFFLHQGLSYSAVLLLYAVDNLLQTVIEIPSGILADRWGRKPVLLLGAAMQAGGFLLIAFGGGIGWYLVAMALHGMALAFVSGSDAAFLYDSLLAAGREGEFRRIEGRAYMFNLIGWGVGGLLGGLLAAQSLALPYILSGLASVLAFFVMATCDEPPRLGIYDGLPLNLLKDALRAVRRNATIRSIIVYSSVIFGFLLVMHKFSQPYLERAGIGLEYFGIIYFIWLMCAAASSNYSERIGNALGLRTYFVLLPIITGAVIIYLGLMQNMLGVALAVLYQFVWGSLRPQMYQIINHEAETSARATLLSMSGFGMSIVYVVAAPLIGWAADRYDFPPALVILGIAVLILGSAAAIMLARRLRTTE